MKIFISIICWIKDRLFISIFFYLKVAYIKLEPLMISGFPPPMYIQALSRKTKNTGNFVPGRPSTLLSCFLCSLKTYVLVLVLIHPPLALAHYFRVF